MERYAISLQYNDAELTRLLAEKPKTLLRIGATKSIGDYILIPEIRRYLEMPDNELYFTVDNTAHLLAQLEAGELDFVILEGIFDKRRYDHFLLRAVYRHLRKGSPVEREKRAAGGAVFRAPDSA